MELVLCRIRQKAQCPQANGPVKNMRVVCIGSSNRVLEVAAQICSQSRDGCFSAQDVASVLAEDIEVTLAQLFVLEETDWVVRLSDDWEDPFSPEERWVLREFSLTKGREYEVLGIEGDCYRICDDEGEPVLFDPSGFQVTDQTWPAEWLCEEGEGGEVYCYPREWAGRGFFEKYFDRVESARDDFIRVVKALYPDTFARIAEK